MAHDVFVSYSEKDKATAEEICGVLEIKGRKCWIAPRDIPSGAPYAGAINNAIRESRVMVFVFSSSANSSPHDDPAHSRMKPSVPLPYWMR